MVQEANFVTEHLLDGNVTLNLVVICFTVASVAVGITLWAVYRFQTKTDAREVELRWSQSLKQESDRNKNAIEETQKRFETSFDSIHDHMTTMKQDQKSDIRQMQNDLSSLRNSMSEVGTNVAFLRGRADKG